MCLQWIPKYKWIGADPYQPLPPNSSSLETCLSQNQDFERQAPSLLPAAVSGAEVLQAPSPAEPGTGMSWSDANLLASVTLVLFSSSFSSKGNTEPLLPWVVVLRGNVIFPLFLTLYRP